MAKFSHYAIAAARQAIDDANWKPETNEEKEKTVSAIICVLEESLGVPNHNIGCLYWVWYG